MSDLLQLYCLGAFLFGVFIVASTDREEASSAAVLPAVLMTLTWPIWAAGTAITVLREMASGRGA